MSCRFLLVDLCMTYLGIDVAWGWVGVRVSGILIFTFTCVYVLLCMFFRLSRPCCFCVLHGHTFFHVVPWCATDEVVMTWVDIGRGTAILYVRVEMVETVKIN